MSEYYIATLRSRNEALKSDNARLRELVGRLADWIEHHSEYIDIIKAAALLAEAQAVAKGK